MSMYIHRIYGNKLKKTFTKKLCNNDISCTMYVLLI